MKNGAKSDAASVTLAYVHPNEVTHSFHQSVVGLVGWELAGHEPHVLQGGWMAMRYGADGLVAARNKAVSGFLSDREDSEWLFWVDTDMGFEPDALDRLLEAADPEERPIVGGLCFAWKERTPDGMGGYRCTANPTIFDWVQQPEGRKGFLGRTHYPVNSLVRCGGTGSAMILIHRSVFERMKKEWGPVWYDRIENSTIGQLMGEDLSFCLRAGALDIPVYVHTGVRATHYKGFWLAESDFWDRAIAPPAAERVAVLIPTMRPQNADPVMRSLRASTGLATAYAVVDRTDHESRAAWESAGAVVIEIDVEGRPGSYPERINLAYRSTQGEPWVFVGADDLRFHSGWLDQALAAASDRYHVIGTNDLGNERVMRGEHATHMLLRRTYIDEQSGSWDTPGTVMHEGYKHYFVDDEVVQAARQRGVFAMALGSHVEHLHPDWGKAEEDDVYRLEQPHFKHDKRHFGERLHAQRAELARAAR